MTYDDRKSAIPSTTWVFAAIMFVLTFFFMTVLMIRAMHAPPPIRFFAPAVVASLVAGYAVLVGYVYGDAKRRGMRYVMWTWLAVLIPNGLGIILYFVLREPTPCYCSKCGGSMAPGFAFCPHCGSNILPACRGSLDKAVRQMAQGIDKKKWRVYISRRWRIIAWIMKRMPSWIYHKL